MESFHLTEEHTVGPERG